MIDHLLLLIFSFELGLDNQLTFEVLVSEIVLFKMLVPRSWLRRQVFKKNAPH